MKINKSKEVKALLQATYPEYKGRKFYLSPMDGKIELHSFWDEGNRTYYKFVNVDTLEVHELESNHPFFEPNRPRYLEELPRGIVIVAYHVNGGGTNHVTFYVRSDEMPKFLPMPSISEVA